jgi:MSHA biogenesis protein MshL
MKTSNRKFRISMLCAAAMAAALHANIGWAQSAVATPVLTASNEIEPRFSFSVTDESAAKVFAFLGMGTPYNVVVPNGLEGKITISLKNVTMSEAMQAISESHGYDYKIVGRRVTVSPNTLTTRVFKLNYLTGNRVGSSSVNVQSGSLTATTPATPAASSTGGAAAPAAPVPASSTISSDSSRVTMTTNEDFWRDTRETMKTMINGEGRSVIMNASAGVLVVKALPREIALVEDYLKAIQVSVQRQVMIEAKIVEVSLADGAQSGVNWSVFDNKNGGNLTLGASGSQSTKNVTIGDAAAAAGWSVAAKTLGTGFYGLAFQGANFSAVLNFLQTQGGVQVLSSPRIATLNNQKALLKVGGDEFFVTNVSATTTSTSTGNVTTPNITLTPFFSGISLDVTPQIDEQGVITMHVHPSISNVTEKSKLVDLGSLGQFQIPSATSSVNETDSMVRIKSGQIAAIGGLMTQSSSKSKSGVPGLSEAPVIGGLFGQKSTDTSKHEVVILIKPTIVDENESYDLDELRKNGVEILPAAPVMVKQPVVKK